MNYDNRPKESLVIALPKIPKNGRKEKLRKVEENKKKVAWCDLHFVLYGFW